LAFCFDYYFKIIMVKNILRIFKPDFSFSNLTDIDPDIFKGAQLIIFDVDGTLFFSETAETSEEIIGWFKKINDQYKCVCLSNSRTIFNRKEKISELLNCEIFLSKHRKPFKKLFKEIKKRYNFENDKVFIIGDKILIDVLFGNLNGTKTILVKSLGRNGI